MAGIAQVKPLSTMAMAATVVDSSSVIVGHAVLFLGCGTRRNKQLNLARTDKWTIFQIECFRAMTNGILIVEDELLIRMDAVTFLVEAGFTVDEAGNADEAIALLELRDDIRVVFTDINMPGSMDGLKLAHYVRGRWPPVHLIVTSGQERPSSADMPSGCGFVSKPYQLENIGSSLRAIVA
jgi:two-component system, response regulator PdtaR